MRNAERFFVLVIHAHSAETSRLHWDKHLNCSTSSTTLARTVNHCVRKLITGSISPGDQKVRIPVIWGIICIPLKTLRYKAG